MAAIAKCALICTGIEANHAHLGLAFLNSAESNPSGTIKVIFGEVPGRPNSPGSNGPSRYVDNLRGAYINTGHETIGVNYQLEAAVVHEVFESYGFLLNGNPRIGDDDELYDSWHRAAIRYAEDPALLGAGLRSRTSRTIPGRDRPLPL